MAASAPPLLRVGAVGIGIMGAPIGMNVLRKGLAADSPKRVQSFCCWNRTESKCAPLAELGAEVVKTPAEVAARSDILLTNVTNSVDVEEILFRADGILAGAKPNLIIVDHSTISPVVTKKIAADLAKRDIFFVDAPVSGGELGAINGTLSIMCGGDEAAIEKARPLMELYSKSINNIGGSGDGQVAKMCNQVVVAAQMSAMAEALVLSQRMGTDPEKVVAAIKGGAAQMWTLDVKPQRVFAGNRAPGFKAKDQTKDLKIIGEVAASEDISLPVTALNTALFTSMVANGEGELDNSAVLCVLEKLNGCQVGPDYGQKK